MKRYIYIVIVALMCFACSKTQTGNPVVPDDNVEANKEILYTSIYKANSNKTINPYDKYAFDATILSNTYQNGKGVIKFNKAVKTIGIQAFYGRDEYATIDLPNSVTVIGSRAFEGCYNLKRITLGNNVTVIGDLAFEGSFDYDGNDGIVIPDSVTDIGDSAFSNSSISSITLSKNLTAIANSAFSDCCRLSTISLPQKLISIGDLAMSGCIFEEIVVPDNVISIGVEAFSYCENLKKAIIGNKVSSIGNNAFDSCGSLTELYCKATVPPTLGNDKSLGDSTNANLTIYVPTNSVDAYKSAKYWSDFNDRIVGYEF